MYLNMKTRFNLITKGDLPNIVPFQCIISQGKEKRKMDPFISCSQMIIIRKKIYMINSAAPITSCRTKATKIMFPTLKLILLFTGNTIISNYIPLFNWHRIYKEYRLMIQIQHLLTNSYFSCALYFYFLTI